MSELQAVSELQAEVIDHRRYVTNRPWEGGDSGEEVVRLLERQGMKSRHSVLDIGCGSLRVGRFLIPTLQKGKYFGIDPNVWLIYMAIEEELPEGLLERKGPTFSDDSNLYAGVFGRKFDYVLICHVLTHGGDKQIGVAIKKAAKALAPGGKIILDLYPGGPHYEGSEWRYPQISHHYQSCLEPAAEAAGLSCTLLGDVGVTRWYRLEKAAT